MESTADFLEIVLFFIFIIHSIPRPILFFSQHTTTMSSDLKLTSSRKRSICTSSVFGDQLRNSQRLKDYETIQFVIPNFKQRCNEKVISYTMVAHGYLWWIEADLSLSTIKTRLFLRENYGSCDSIKWTIEYSTRSRTKRTNFIRKTFDKDNHHTEDHIYLKRDDSIQQCLEEDGSLVIEYDIRMIETPLYGDKPIWYPNELQPQSFLKELYDNASSKTSDVSFLVEGRIFRVHKSILSKSHRNTPIQMYLFHWMTLQRFFKVYWNLFIQSKHQNPRTLILL